MKRRMGRRPAHEPPPNTPKHRAGRRLRAVRDMLGWPTELMANTLGVSVKALQAYEGGQNSPGTDVLFRLWDRERIPMEFISHGDARRVEFDLLRRLVASGAEIEPHGTPAPNALFDPQPDDGTPRIKRNPGGHLHEPRARRFHE